jgi:hypothetical protein
MAGVTRQQQRVTVNELQALNHTLDHTCERSGSSSRRRQSVGMSMQPHPTSRARNFPGQAVPPHDRTLQTFRFPPHSQAQSYQRAQYQPADDDSRPGMDSALYYPQYPPVQSQDRRRPDELTPSDSSSHVSPVLLDRSPADAMNSNRKRVNSAGPPGPARKKARRDEEPDDSASPPDIAETKEQKPKSTRGARYVLFGVIYPTKSGLALSLTQSPTAPARCAAA